MITLAKPVGHVLAGNLVTLRLKASQSRNCPLWRNTTRTVFGRGPAHATSGLLDMATRVDRDSGDGYRQHAAARALATLPGARRDGEDTGRMQIIADHARIHRLRLALIVDLLEQALPGQLLHATHDPHQAPVVHPHLAILPALAAAGEAQPPTLGTHMAGAQGGEAVTTIDVDQAHGARFEAWIRGVFMRRTGHPQRVCARRVNDG